MRYGKVSSKGERAALGGQGETGVGTYSPVRLCPAHERSESCVKREVARIVARAPRGSEPPSFPSRSNQMMQRMANMALPSVPYVARKHVARGDRREPRTVGGTP